MEIASAPRRLAASSKLVRVRVEASKNRFTTMRALQQIQLAEALLRAATWKSRARSRMAWTSSRVRFSMPSRPAAFHAPCIPATLSTISTFSMPSISLNFTSMISLADGLHHAADVARFDGQFAMAAVDQHQQLHARRASLIEQRVERRADGAAGIEHVVHQNHVLAGDWERDVGRVQHRLMRDRGKVVTVEIDVENSDRNLAMLQRFDFFARRWARGTPRRRMPMKASLSRSSVRSRISCASRTRVRSISEALISWDFSRVTGIGG